MKLLYHLLFFLFFPKNIIAQNNYHIIGTLKNSNGKTIYLGRKGFMINRNIQKYNSIDSCISKNDSFEFRGLFSEKGLFSIDTGNNDWLTFLIDTGKIYITGNVDTIYKSQVENSPENYIFKSFESTYEHRIWRMYDVAQDSAWTTGVTRNDTFAMKIYDEAKSFHQEQMVRHITSFIKAYPNNFYAAYLLPAYEFFFDKQLEKTLFSYLSDDLQKNSYLERTRIRLFESPDSINAGSPSIDFSMPDINGNVVNTKNYRGKYLLLNFWASWCIPCKAELPLLIELYKNFHQSGLEIISISLDISKEKWIEAVKETKIPWVNVSDLKGETSRLPILYNAQRIPRNILIDKEGVILESDIKKEDLEDKIKPIFTRVKTVD